jgi:glycosyltransferase involved in cell wall biosynthesis
VSRFDVRKKNIILAEALGLISEDYEIKWTLIGALPDDLNPVYQDFERKLEDLPDQVEVEIVGEIEHNKVLDIMDMSDIYVLPSANEPASFSHLEAMARGLPVICSDTNGTSTYVQENVNGFVFKTDDCRSLAKCLIELIGDKNLVRRMGYNSWKLVKENHRPEQVADKFVRLFHQN